MSNAINPYRPAPVSDEESNDSAVDVDAVFEASIRLTDSQLRHAESHYLLRWHPITVLVGSLTMIAISFAVIVMSMRFHPFVFLMIVGGLLAASTIIYLLLVHTSKVKLRQRLIDYGFADGVVLQLQSTNEKLTLVSPNGTFHWPNEQLATYRIRNGLLVCPESLFFIFVPKVSDFSCGSYRNFWQLLFHRAGLPKVTQHRTVAPIPSAIPS